MKTNDNSLVIVSGGSRGIGKAFADHYEANGSRVIRFSRKQGRELYQLDLTDEKAARKTVSEIDLSGIERITYFHAIGIDKFEPHGFPEIDENGDGIDDEVYSSNYQTMRNLADPLIGKSINEVVPITMVNIGSVSDPFEVPFWQSFTKSMNLVRQYSKSRSNELVKGVVLNISSTLDEERNTYGRTHADTTYWLTAQELVDMSVNDIDAMKDRDAYHAEFDYYKPHPGYTDDYFTNLPALYRAWQQDLGFVGQEIPMGLRI